MHKTQKGFALIETVLILVVVAILAGTGYYVWQSKDQTDKSLSNSEAVSQSVPNTQKNTPATPPASSTDSTPGFSTFTGTVTKIDLSQMAVDGPGVYIVSVEGQGSTQVSLLSGAANCDAEAVVVPANVHVGDQVSVSSHKGGGAQVVCDKGTYIKLKQ